MQCILVISEKTVNYSITACMVTNVTTAMCTSGHALQCKLFDTLVLPILSYGCEVWGVDTKRGAAAEALHRDFLRRLLGVRKSTVNHMVLAELGRFPLQVHFWQQILRFHHRTIALDNVRLVKLAMVDGFALHQTAVKDSWQHYLGDFLHGHFRTAAAFSQF